MKPGRHAYKPAKYSNMQARYQNMFAQGLNDLPSISAIQSLSTLFLTVFKGLRLLNTVMKLSTDSTDQAKQNVVVS